MRSKRWRYERSLGPTAHRPVGAAAEAIRRGLGTVALGCLQATMIAWLLRSAGIGRGSNKTSNSAPSRPGHGPVSPLPSPREGEEDGRAYRLSGLPVLLRERPNELSPQQQQDVLLRLYGEICGTWRQLTDVRFKLLALVPAVSVFVLIALFKGDPLTGSAAI